MVVCKRNSLDINRLLKLNPMVNRENKSHSISSNCTYMATYQTNVRTEIKAKQMISVNIPIKTIDITIINFPTNHSQKKVNFNSSS